MVIDRKFPRYPNYTFLQLEEINQTIYNYLRNGFYKWYCIDISKLINKYNWLGNSDGINLAFHNIRYDFTIISCDIVGKQYTYTFEIRNTLWTGKWKITTIDGETINKDSYTATTDNKNGNILKISGENLKQFLLCLELSNEDKSRHIETNELIIRFEKEYKFTHQFDTSSYEEVKVLNANTNKPVEGVTVKLVPLNEKREYVDTKLETDKDKKDMYPYLKSYTATTNDKGIARILFDKTPTPAIYYARLDGTKGNSTCFTNVTDERVQNYTRTIDNTDNLTMYKGEIRTFTFNITPINKYGVGYKPKSETYLVNIYHKYDSAQNVPLVKSTVQKMKTEKYTAYTDKDGNFEVTLSSREFYGDMSQLIFELPATSKFEQVTSEPITIKHEWLYAKDFAHLKSVCENKNGADAIVLYNKDYERTDNNTINITRKQYVMGAKGNQYATINSNYSNPLFTLKKGDNTSKELMNMLVLNGVRVVNGLTVIEQEGNSYVQILNSLFEGNKGTNYIGAVLNQSDTSSVALISNNYFFNNYGNNICGRGNVEIDNNLFKVTDVKYTYQPEPIVLEQFQGTGIIKNNQIYVNTSIDYSSGKAVIKAFPKNRSYAKISVWVGKTAKVNGKGVNELRRDNSFNFFDAPYNNKAYIFSIYYYPYDNVKTNIVAYATGNRINRASGHAVEGTNWAWKDGYYLVREEYKNYSTYNPFVTIKNGKVIEDTAIFIPNSGGVI